MNDDALEHVYVVDDEPAVLVALRRTLERAGLAVSCFATADECLTRLGAGKCDLLITDVKMPDKDGIELLMEVKKTRPWLPVLVMTAFGDVPMAVKAFKAGAADLLEKPLARDSFIEAVRTLLASNAIEKTLLDHALTRMELKVLRHILEGKNNREIADTLHRSPRTVEVHRRHLMQKLGANNIVELLRQAARLHLFDVGASGVGMRHARDVRP
jgi:two-component system, LuxR family, response regulator FixJ